MANKEVQCTGGRSEIRTHGTLAGTPVFKTGALNHSATLPDQEFQSLTVAADRTQCERGPKLNRTAFCPGKVSHERATAAQESSRTPASQSSRRRNGQQRRYCLATTVPE
jgi:hypothetical protein